MRLRFLVYLKSLGSGNLTRNLFLDKFVSASSFGLNIQDLLNFFSSIRHIMGKISHLNNKSHYFLQMKVERPNQSYSLHCAVVLSAEDT